MDSVPYGRKKLLVKTIPKGTLLFRLSKDIENDLRGVPLEDKTRCIAPHFKVFFYANPFASEFAFKQYLSDYDKNIYVFILTEDIHVFNLLNPSPYTRQDKTRKRFFLKRCSTVKQGCLPKKLNEYDACFSDTIIKKYPNIVGYIANVWSDSVSMKKTLHSSENAKYKKYFNFAEDIAKVKSIPELAIYPLVSRSSKNVIVNSEDKLENSYKLFRKFNRNDKKSIVSFMDNHTTFNPETFYFNYKE